MTVRKLISELKKMPQNLQVYYAAHDNSEWEISGDLCHVSLFDKNDEDCQPPDYVKDYERQWYEDQPNRAVVLRG